MVPNLCKIILRNPNMTKQLQRMQPSQAAKSTAASLMRDSYALHFLHVIPACTVQSVLLNV